MGTERFSVSRTLKLLCLFGFPLVPLGLLYIDPSAVLLGQCLAGCTACVLLLLGLWKLLTIVTKSLAQLTTGKRIAFVLLSCALLASFVWLHFYPHEAQKGGWHLRESGAYLTVRSDFGWPMQFCTFDAWIPESESDSFGYEEESGHYLSNGLLLLYFPPDRDGFNNFSFEYLGLNLLMLLVGFGAGCLLLFPLFIERITVRWALGLLVTCLIWFLLFLAPFDQGVSPALNAVEFIRWPVTLRQKVFDRVKDGQASALVTNSKLLPTLAGDSDCRRTLTDLKFASTVIDPEDAKYVAQLRSVKSMTFYHTVGTRELLLSACTLPISEIRFERPDLSNESYLILKDFPDLQRVVFEHDVDSDVIYRLRSELPDLVVVTTAYRR